MSAKPGMIANLCKFRRRPSLSIEIGKAEHDEGRSLSPMPNLVASICRFGRRPRSTSPAHHELPIVPSIKQDDLQRVIDIVQPLLTETNLKKAIAKLVVNAQDIVDCDGIGFFMRDACRGMVCYAAADGGEIDWVVDPGVGVAGKVLLTRATVNIADARNDPSFLYQSKNAQSSAQSLICVALKGQNGQVIAMIEAINKRAQKQCLDSSTLTSILPLDPKDVQKFDAMDEVLFKILLSLTHQHLHSLAFAEQSANATQKAESLLRMVDHLSASNLDVSECLCNLSNTVCVHLCCQRCFVCLVDGPKLYCAAVSPSLYSSSTDGQADDVTEKRREMFNFTDANSALMGAVVQSGQGKLLGPGDAEDLEMLAKYMPDDGLTPTSALLSPLLTCDGDVFGVVVVVNKLKGCVSSEEENKAPVKHTGSSAFSLDERVRQGRKNTTPKAEHDLKRIAAASGTASFTQLDMQNLDMLLTFAAPAVRTADVHHQQRSFNSQLQALLKLCTDCVSGLASCNLEEIIHALCIHGRGIFNCDRCSFFAVDPLASGLLAWFLESDGVTLSKHNIPRRGIVGLSIDTGKPLNISDAWNDPNFSKETDLKTGYHTKTILCEPIISQTGKVIGAIQCINKLSGLPFNAKDDEVFAVVSKMISGLIEKQMSAASMEALLERDDLDQDAKEAMQLFTANSVAKKGKHLWKQVKKWNLRRRSSSLLQGEKLYTTFLNWDLDYFGLDSETMLTSIPAAFAHFDLLDQFGIGPLTLTAFVNNIRSDYVDNPYHNWLHAFATFHLLVLLVADVTETLRDKSNGIEVSDIDRLASNPASRRSHVSYQYLSKRLKYVSM